MKQQTFEQKYTDVWQQLETALDIADKKKSYKSADQDPQLPELYRRVCHHLSLAQERRYSSYLVSKLNSLVLRGHQRLYRRQTQFIHALVKFVTYTFAHRLRENASYFWLATALFYGPGLLVFGLIQWKPELIYHFMSYMQVANLESMYDPTAERFGTDRAAESDVMMFGHYIQNNISIGLRTFATGLVFCLGSLFFIIYNGIYIGAAASHIDVVGYHETFFPFVVGHGSFELTAITIAGAAGLMLGFSLLRPGNLTRLAALRQAAIKSLDLVYGVIIMLIIAAFIEAFWSSNSALSPDIKYTVGALSWIFVIVYLTFAGRNFNANTSHLMADQPVQKES